MFVQGILYGAGRWSYALVLWLCAAAAGNDLLVTSDGGPTRAEGVLRFNGSTGALIGKFIDVSNPYSMIYGPDGNIYVGTDGAGIRRYDPQTGVFLSTFVPKGSGSLITPYDLAFGPDGNLYVADRSSTAILRYNGSTGAFINAWGKTGSAALTRPQGLTFDTNGILYVSDDHIIKRYDQSGAYVGSFLSGPGIEDARHPRFGPDGDFYVGGNSDLRRYNGSSGAFIRSMSDPTGAIDIAFGEDGRVYADYFSSEIGRWNPATGAFIGKFVTADTGIASPRALMFMVPEPGTIFFAAVGTAILLRRRRR